MAENASGKEEKRGTPRVQKLFMIAYVSQDEQPTRTPLSLGRTIDISSSGVGMEVYREIAVGTVMEMEIDLSDLPVPAWGKVVRIDPLDNGNYRIGIRFDEEQELLQARLAGAELAALRTQRGELQGVMRALVKNGWPWAGDGQPNGVAHSAGDGFAAAMLAAKRLLAKGDQEIAELPEPKG